MLLVKLFVYSFNILLAGEDKIENQRLYNIVTNDSEKELKLRHKDCTRKEARIFPVVNC